MRIRHGGRSDCDGKRNSKENKRDCCSYQNRQKSDSQMECKKVLQSINKCDKMDEKGGEAMNNIREEMLRYRALNKLTQAQAAEKCGVSVYTWKVWETGKQKPTAVNEMRLKLLFNN